MKPLPLLILLTLIGFPSFLSAQWTLGVEGGAVRTWQDYGDTPLPEDARTHLNRVQLSAQVYLRLTRQIWIGLEPSYAQRGAACLPGFGGNAFFVGDSRLYLDYWYLPVFFQYRQPMLKGRWELYGKVGVGRSLMMRSVEENETTGARMTWSRFFPNPFNPFNGAEMGWSSSLGLARNWNQHQLFLGINHYRSWQDAVPGLPSLHRSISLVIGYGWHRDPASFLFQKIRRKRRQDGS
ncbi:MAG: hypothetical protein AAF399_01125 [Bacteroidota bacterium]